MDKAAKAKSLVSTSHYAFPGLGRVAAKGKSWEWQPIPVTAIREAEPRPLAQSIDPFERCLPVPAGPGLDSAFRRLSVAASPGKALSVNRTLACSAVKTSKRGGRYCYFGCVFLISMGSLWGTGLSFALDFITLLSKRI
jgi:hypothetical protein